MSARRGVWLVFGLIGLAMFVSASALLAGYVVLWREPEIKEHSTLVVRIGRLSEMEPTSVVSQFLVSPPTVRSLVDSLRKAKVDSRVASVVITPAAAQPLWAKVQELRDAILDFKRSGKPIVGYLEFGGDQQYYLAAACDKVFLMPTSPLDLNGLASYELFFRGTLDKIGTYPDLLHIGDYKTMSNTFTEKQMTPAHREMSEALNSDMFDQLVRGIADARKKSEAEVRALIDEGPFLPEDAVRLGLVDDLAYEDQLDDKARLGGRKLQRLEEEEYRKVSASSLGLNRGPKLAIIYAVGAIVQGESRGDSAEGAVLGSDTIVKYIRTARADNAIKAIVLRIDSPGGSALASDVIWREILLTRNQKPVIASMGDVAASGGYYIAMPAHAIVAEPSTLTGSIGIVVGKFVTGGTFEKLGIGIDAVSQGANAEMNSPMRPYTPKERAKVEEQMQAVYDTFVEKAAEGRNSTPEKIDAVGQGRVWTGRQARQVGLVDDLGGLMRAIALAKQRARIPQDSEVQLVIYPPKKSFYELVSSPLASARTALLSRLLLSPEETRVITTLAVPMRLFRRGEPLALMPNVFLH